MDHNVGKIHDANHATFHLQYMDRNAVRREETLIIGPSFRKTGLGKDGCHRQFLSGLPGVQKAALRWLIAWSKWVLHKMPPHTRTVCMEFFGQVRDSVPSIVG